jgi:hypothetical protein
MLNRHAIELERDAAGSSDPARVRALANVTRGIAGPAR